MGSYPDNQPVIVERGEGRELIDVDGRRYLDAISSLWVNTLGHHVAELDQALREQIDRVAHTTMLGNGNRIVIEFAEALAAVVPVDGAHVLFASDGASAVEQALKIAFQFWTNRGDSKRHKYLAFEDGYHGDTVGALSVGDRGFGTFIFDPLRFPVLRAPSFADPSSLTVAARMVEAHADELAAVVVEPWIQAAGGMNVAPPAAFAELGAACLRTGVLLICDEVATGFGRTGSLFACDALGIRPDLLCLGKGITGGYLPMSATVAAQHVFDAFTGPDLSELTLYHGHSYGGNALAAAVALRHLQLIDEWQVLDNVRARSTQLHDTLRARVAPRRIVRDIRACGLMAAVELEPVDGARLARRVCAEMVRRGVLSRSLGPIITLVPPLTITADEIDHIVDTVAGAIDHVSGV